VQGVERARQLAIAELELPFDLARGPLVRAAILRLGPKQHWLLVSMHHIITDGWSIGVLIDELSLLYGGGELPPLPVQYPDFAIWQRRYLSGDVLRQQLAYWKTQLSGMPELLELPTDRPRPPAMSYRGATYAFAISADLTRSLEVPPGFPDEDAERSLLMGETGIRMVLQRLAPSSANRDRLEQLVASNERDERCELMWGSPGTILAGRELGLDLTMSIEWLQAQRDADGLWTQQLGGRSSRCLGPAHGFAGCVLALGMHTATGTSARSGVTARRGSSRRSSTYLMKSLRSRAAS
jgi:hypothetical protein